jgi:hypothetical protein
VGVLSVRRGQIFRGFSVVLALSLFLRSDWLNAKPDWAHYVVKMKDGKTYYAKSYELDSNTGMMIVRFVSPDGSEAPRAYPASDVQVTMAPQDPPPPAPPLPPAVLKNPGSCEDSSGLEVRYEMSAETKNQIIHDSNCIGLMQQYQGLLGVGDQDAMEARTQYLMRVKQGYDKRLDDLIDDSGVNRLAPPAVDRAQFSIKLQAFKENPTDPSSVPGPAEALPVCLDPEGYWKRVSQIEEGLKRSRQEIEGLRGEYCIPFPANGEKSDNGIYNSLCATSSDQAGKGNAFYLACQRNRCSKDNKTEDGRSKKPVGAGVLPEQFFGTINYSHIQMASDIKEVGELQDQIIWQDMKVYAIKKIDEVMDLAASISSCAALLTPVGAAFSAADAAMMAKSGTITGSSCASALPRLKKAMDEAMTQLHSTEEQMEKYLEKKYGASAMKIDPNDMENFNLTKGVAGTGLDVKGQLDALKQIKEAEQGWTEVKDGISGLTSSGAVDASKYAAKMGAIGATLSVGRGAFTNYALDKMQETSSDLKDTVAGYDNRHDQLRGRVSEGLSQLKIIDQAEIDLGNLNHQMTAKCNDIIHQLNDLDAQSKKNGCQLVLPPFLSGKGPFKEFLQPKLGVEI